MVKLTDPAPIAKGTKKNQQPTADDSKLPMIL